MSAFLVLDGGSSKIKGLICDEKGKVLSSSEISLLPVYSKDRVEYDPLEVLKAHLSVLSSLLSSWKGEITSFSLTGQRSSFLLMDENGKPLTPLVSWQDGRAKNLLDSVDLSQEEVNRITGLYKTPYYSASKAAWFLKQNSELSSRRPGKNIFFASLPTYLLFHLSRGSFSAIDPTFAQRTLLFDAASGKWSEKLCSAFGIDPRILPEIIPTFSPSSADINWDGRKLPFHAMAGDQQAAALPFLRQDAAVSNFGTGAFILTPCESNFIRIPGILTSVSNFSGGKMSYMLEGTVNSCGTFLKWLELKLGISVKTDAVSALPASADRLFALPAIGGIGSPYWDYSTRTAFSGFKPETGSEDLVRASLEGIVFLLNESFTLMRAERNVSKIMVYGGLSLIDYLPAFQSDITGLKSLRPAQKEATALGLAHFSASSLGFDCSGWDLLSVEKEFSPRLSREESSILISRWKDFFNSVRKVYNK